MSRRVYHEFERHSMCVCLFYRKERLGGTRDMPAMIHLTE